jgi:hypothetical protein
VDHVAPIVAFVLCFAAWLGCLWRLWPMIREELDLPRPLALGLGGVMAAQALVITTTVVHGPWATMTHGLERLADLQGPEIPVNLQHLHGPGFLVTVGGPFLVSGELLHPYAISTLLTLASTLALALAAWWARQDASHTLAVAIAFGFGPVVLRLAPTTSLYVPAVWWLLAAIATTELYLRRDAPLALMASGCAVAAAAMTRADFLLFAPLVVGLRVLTERPAILGKPRHLLMGAAPALFLVPRLAELQSLADTRTSHGPALALPENLGPWVALAAAAAVTWHLRRRLTVPVWGALVLGAGLQIGARFQPPILARISPFWDAATTSPTWPLVSALGFAVLVHRRPRSAVWLGGVVVAATALYWPSVDSASTWVRTGAAAWWAWSWLLAEAVAAVGPVGDRPARLALLATAAWPLVADPWVGHVYPRQHEHRLLDATLAELPDDATLVLLSVTDVPDGVDPSTHHQLLNRGAVARYLGGTNHRAFDVDRHGTTRGEARPWTLQSIGDALASPDHPGPRYFLETLDCHRLLHGDDPLRPLAGDVPLALDAPLAVAPHRPEHDIALQERARAIEIPDGPCVRMHRSFRLDPVIRVPISHENAGASREQVVGGEPEIGLYRVAKLPKGK